MTVKEYQHDLLWARQNAKKILDEKSLKHIVYAYETKLEPGVTYILDWHPVEFKTDKDFEEWQKTNQDELGMVFAVHAW